MRRFKKWLPLIVLSVAIGVVTMDLTITSVSLNAIIASLHTNLRTFQWIIASYSLVLGAFTITGGRLGDKFGRKRMFLLGAVLFALGSIVTATAHRAGAMLVGDGLIEGLGAALMSPSSSALLLSMYQERKERALAFGFYTGAAGLAASIGPLLGGYLTTYHSWRWAYFINPFIVGAVLLFSRVLKDSRETSRTPTINLLSVLLSSVGLAGIVFGVVESSAYGWFGAKQPFALFSHTLFWSDTLSVAFAGLVSGLIVVALFVYYQRVLERRNLMPLVSGKLLANKQFMSGTVTSFVITAAQYGSFFLLPILWQVGLGFNSFHSGLASIALPVAILVAAPVGGILSAHFGIRPKRIAQFGILLSLVGLLWLRFVVSATISPWLTAPALAVFGVGFGLTISPLANLTLSAVSVQTAGEATGVNSTFRQIGSSFGQALIGAIAIAGLINSFASSIDTKLPLPRPVKIAIVQNVQENQEEASSSNRFRQLPKKDQAVVAASIRQAAINGDRKGLVVGVVLAGLAFVIASIFLPLNMRKSGDLK